MPKHNIDLIARVVYEGKRAYAMGTNHTTKADAPLPWDELAAEDQRAVKHDVLEAIHGETLVDAAFNTGTDDERRQSRLFAGIVKALTVLMRPAVEES